MTPKQVALKVQVRAAELGQDKPPSYRTVLRVLEPVINSKKKVSAPLVGKVLSSLLGELPNLGDALDGFCWQNLELAGLHAVGISPGALNLYFLRMHPGKDNPWGIARGLPISLLSRTSRLNVSIRASNF